jgi:hypothetical protein
MSDDDYHGIKMLLSQAAVGPLAAITSLCELITDQVNVGVVVAADGGEAGVSGFGTILNIEQHKIHPGMSTFRSFVSDLSKKHPKKSKLINSILSGNEEFRTGLLLKERLVNFPPELVPNLHKVLVEDVQWSMTSEFVPDAGEKREDYNFEYVLLLSAFEIESGTRIEDEEAQNPGHSDGLGHKKKRKLDRQTAQASRIYLHWEDEVFFENALFSHAWQNASKPVVYRANKKFQSYFLLYALRYSDYVELTTRLAQSLQ